MFKKVPKILLRFWGHFFAIFQKSVSKPLFEGTGKIAHFLKAAHGSDASDFLCGSGQKGLQIFLPEDTVEAAARQTGMKGDEWRREIICF